MSPYARHADPEAFESSHTLFAALVDELAGPDRRQDTHTDLEHWLTQQSRELTRQLLQDHLDLRAAREQRHTPGIIGADEIPRTRVEHGHSRALSTVVGQVRVQRAAYRAPGARNLYPADAALNLPATQHSHGLRRLAAIEAARGSFDSAVAAIERASGVRLGKRQVQQLAAAAAGDVDTFYAQRDCPAGVAQDLLVLSYDGKGIVMRPDALRPATARKAQTKTGKLVTRVSKGEKRHRKRMAEIGAVYDAVPAARGPADILPVSDQQRRPGPQARGKWLTASVIQDTACVVAAVFDHAARRDPDRQRRWVVLLDGNTHQIDRTHAEARARGVDVAVVVDFIHVLEYLWKAAWCFFTEGDPTAEAWVRHHALAVLAGRATAMARVIRRTATIAGLAPARRLGVDACAGYLLNKARYLDYPTALAAGWPIATGVIEGACRYLVKDRMDITGARWGLAGAEAVLKLRVLHANGDFQEYWRYHLAQERHRVHETRYLDNIVPTAA